MIYKHQNWELEKQTRCVLFNVKGLISHIGPATLEVTYPHTMIRYDNEGRIFAQANPTLFIEEEVEPQIGDKVFCSLLNKHGEIVAYVTRGNNHFPVKVLFPEGRTNTYDAEGVAGYGFTPTLHITKRASSVVTEMTIAEIAKKLGMNPSLLRIKD
jgi:hypothetical protein